MESDFIENNGESEEKMRRGGYSGVSDRCNAGGCAMRHIHTQAHS